jgi:transcriptional regulator of acetoin/glycerol metabolism
MIVKRGWGVKLRLKVRGKLACSRIMPTMTLAETVRRAIMDAVAEAGGNMVLAAKALGIGKTTVYRKMAEYKKVRKKKKAKKGRKKSRR